MAGRENREEAREEEKKREEQEENEPCTGWRCLVLDPCRRKRHRLESFRPAIESAGEKSEEEQGEAREESLGSELAMFLALMSDP